MLWNAHSYLAFGFFDTGSRIPGGFIFLGCRRETHGGRSIFGSKADVRIEEFQPSGFCDTRVGGSYPFKGSERTVRVIPALGNTPSLELDQP
ncbi:hypothetical protein FBZ98_11258 [Rhizobium sp. ERR 922]|nr:hypothetical protein FBZ98_11258 [Rhizobium sp. ERR 922]TWB88777.1 hypothetical protein FBZ97_11258 [Rhizobium sp. ERR 942]